MAQQTRKRPPTAGSFKPGQSGNPAGKPPGARSHASVLAETILSRDVERIAEVVTKAALAGDMQAARLVVDKLLPARRGFRLTMPLPPIQSADDITKASAAVLQAVSDGTIDTAEAEALAGIVEAHRRTIETTELATRLALVEAKLEKGREA